MSTSLVYNIEALQGINQIRRNISRVSANYMDCSEISTVVQELADTDSVTVTADRILVRTKSKLDGILTIGSTANTVVIDQVFMVDFTCTLELTNNSGADVQVQIVKATK